MIESVHFYRAKTVQFSLAVTIDEAYQFVTSKGIKVVREIEWAGETAWFNIEDPDGNVIMICNS